MVARRLVGLVLTVVSLCLTSNPVLADTPIYWSQWADLLNTPGRVAVDPAGSVYVTDTNNHRVRRYDFNGNLLDWDGTVPGLSGPRGIARGPDGTIYVADTGNNRVVVYTSTGGYLRVIGGPGSGEGQFDTPLGIAVDIDNYIYVADMGHHRILKFGSDGSYHGFWGSFGTGQGQFNQPQGVAAQSFGPVRWVYVTDYNNHRVQKFTGGGAYLTQWGANGSGNGQFILPQDVTFGDDGVVYVSDTGNHRIQKFDTDGAYLGQWGSYGSGNGQFNLPLGIAVAYSSAFVVDSGNNRVQRFLYPFSIAASAGAGGTISPAGTITVPRGGSQSFTITPNACHHITDITVDGVSQGVISSYPFTDVQTNHTISATFAINTYTITASAGPNGSITPTGAVGATCGLNQTFTITPNACYQIANVMIDGVSQGAISTYTFTNVQANHTIAATFATTTYTIAASAGPNGSISPSDAVFVNCGTNRSFVVTPNSCYQIADVVVDGTSVGAVASYTFPNVQANHTINATFVGPQPCSVQWTINGVALTTAADYQQGPQIVSDGAGGAIVAWQDQRDGNVDIYAQRVNGMGVPQWTTDGVALCTAAGNQIAPSIASDGTGGAIVTWQDARSNTSDIYAHHVLASGAIDPAWTAGGLLLCNAANDQRAPQIVADGAGGAIVTWQDYRDGNSDIYSQRVLASGMVDPTWIANGTGLCNAATHQLQPRIVADGAGGAIVTWQDLRNGNPDIYAQHVQAFGIVDPAWTANGTLLCSAGGEQVNQTITSDGAGGAIVTWQDSRIASGSDIYAQHVMASGLADPTWTAHGTLMCNAAFSQNWPQIVSDGAGGAIVTWYDLRSGGGYDIYAQHVMPSGVVDPAWIGNGTLICNAVTDQLFPQIVSDGAGGAIVAWQDYRGLDATADIYAQHVLSSGVVDPTWTANGNGICRASNSQIRPQIIADGAGGAIVTWDDYRNGGIDIYAQRIFRTSDVTAVIPGRVERFELRAPHPNPANDGTTISLDLPTAGRVSVGVYSVSGQLVRALVSERDLPASSQTLFWDGTSDTDMPVSTGVYFIRVTAGGTTATRRVAILR